MRVHVGDEAHVEHAVGFVEDQRLDLAEVDALLLDVVEQAARRGDQHLDAALELGDLRLDVDAAEDAGTRSWLCLAVGLDAIRRPAVGQLAGRGQDQRAHRVAGRRGAGVLAWRSIRCSSGSEKAAVLPVPVWAAPITSWPLRTIGIALAWIGVGLV